MLYRPIFAADRLGPLMSADQTCVHLQRLKKSSYPNDPNEQPDPTHHIIAHRCRTGTDRASWRYARRRGSRSGRPGRLL